MAELWNLLLQLVEVLAAIGWQVAQIVKPWLLLIVWSAWWLWAVDWKQLWPTLAEGAWAPLTLLVIAGAMAWSLILPRSMVFLGFEIPNFWWQLAGVGLLTGYTLFLGWVQMHYRWAPPEVVFETASGHHDHGEHGHH